MTDLNDRPKTRSAVESALSTVVTEVCWIIVDYAVIDDYRWTDPNGPRRLIGESGDYELPKSTVSNVGTHSHLLHADGFGSMFWSTYVSGTTFQTGGDMLTVGYIRQPKAGFVAAGVTTATENTTNLIGHIDDEDGGVSLSDNWILQPRWKVAHNGELQPMQTWLVDRTIDEDDRPSIGCSCRYDGYVEFVVDRRRLEIGVRLSNENRIAVLLQARSVAEFCSLRPCVVMAGQAKAVLISEVFQ